MTTQRTTSGLQVAATLGGIVILVLVLGFTLGWIHHTFTDMQHWLEQGGASGQRLDGADPPQ